MSELFVGSWSGEPVAQEQPSTWRPHPWLTAMRDTRAQTGEIITAESFFRHTPIWHGLLLLGGDAGSLELKLREQRDGEETDNTEHVAYRIASRRPHPLICPATFWELALPRAFIWGNSVFEIARAESGRPIDSQFGGGMTPLDPDTTGPEFDDQGKLWITTRDRIKGFAVGEKRFIDPMNTFHLRNLTQDGFWGVRALDIARDRIANGMGFQRASNRFMRNSMRPDFFISFPEELSEEDRKYYQERLLRENKGLDNVGQTFIADQNATVKSLGMTFEDAQFLELVRQDVIFCASLLGIPANMLNSMVQMTFSNVEESERHYINRTLRRWLKKIQEELAFKLLTIREQSRFRFMHDLRPLLMSKLSDRFAAYSQAIASRVWNPNEVRAMEGFNPYDGGDEFLNPNVLSGGGAPEDDEDEEPEETPEQNRIPSEALLARELHRVLRFEDSRTSEAAKKERNFVRWAEEFYKRPFLEELSGLAPNQAFNYCSDRYKLLLAMAGAVNSKESLAELILAQRSTAPDRVYGLLNREKLPNGVAA